MFSILYALFELTKILYFFINCTKKIKKVKNRFKRLIIFDKKEQIVCKKTIVPPKVAGRQTCIAVPDRIYLVADILNLKFDTALDSLDYLQ